MPEVLCEAELRRLSKDYHKIFVSSDLASLENLLDQLFFAVETPTLSPRHRAAAFNALCGFLDLGSSADLQEKASSVQLEAEASSKDLQTLCTSQHVWERGVALFLERSHDPNSRPVRQLLDVLLKLVDRTAATTSVDDSHADSNGSIQAPATIHSSSRAPDATTCFLVAQSEACVQAPAEDKSHQVRKTEGRIRVQGTLCRCLRFVLAVDDFSCIKPAMILLELCLSRGTFSLSSLLTLIRAIHSESCSTDGFLTASKEDHSAADFSLAFVTNILRWARFLDIAPSAGRLLVTFLRQWQSHCQKCKCHSGRLIDFWLPHLVETIQGEPETLEIYERYVLPPLLSLSQSETQALVETLPIQSLLAGRSAGIPESEIRLCLLIARLHGQGTALYLGKSATALEKGHEAASASVNALQVEALSTQLLTHAASSVRSAAFALLVSGGASTRPFSSHTIARLRLAIPIMHFEVDTRPRVEFLSSLKRLCGRLNSAIVALRRDSVSSSSASVASDSLPSMQLQQHTDFATWYIGWLLEELSPTAPYQRHVSALKAIAHVINTGLHQTLEYHLHGSLLRSLLLDLTLNAFDDVRSLAASLLKGFPREDLLPYPVGPDTADEKMSILTRAASMVRDSGRADFGDGCGRLHGLFFSFAGASTGPGLIGSAALLDRALLDLQCGIETAQRNLMAAVAGFPIHGDLIAIRSMLSAMPLQSAFSSDAWHNLVAQLKAHCDVVWQIVRPVLCVDSPEGQHDGAEDHGQYDIGSKDTLSYCWRSLKESSSLIGCLIAVSGSASVEETYRISSQEINDLGSLTFEQMHQLRHRGAFSTVAQTFTSCCECCANSKDPDMANLPRKWYQMSIRTIHEQAGKLTRRSAGIPAMLVAILTPYVHDPFVTLVLKDLEAIAMAPVASLDDDALHLPQVHALNCLKDIFANSRLGLATEGHVDDALSIAVAALKSQIWAIRNCGVMLFKSLLARLCGGSTLSATSSVEAQRRFTLSTYNRYPQLPEILMRLLSQRLREGDSLVESARLQAVFPALEVIERIGLPPTHGEKLQRLLHDQLSSPYWYLREKAARALAQHHDDASLLDDLLVSMPSERNLDQNQLHGSLMCLKLIIERHKTIREGSDALEKVLQLDHLLLEHGASPFALALALDITRTVMQANSLTTNGVVELPAVHATGNQELLLHKVKKVLQETETQYHAGAHDILQTAFGRLSAVCTAFHKGHEATGQELYEALGQCQAMGTHATRALLDSFKTDRMIVSFDTLDELMLFAQPLSSLDSDVREARISFLASALHTFHQNKTQGVLDVSVQTTILQNLWSFVDDTIQRMSESPSLQYAVLDLCGSAMQVLTAIYPAEQTRACFRKWTVLLRSSLDHCAELSLRLAAVKSLTRFQQGYMTFAQNPRPEHLPSWLILYDALLDDDDEVRLQAADLTSNAFASTPALTGPLYPGAALTPVAAVDELLRFLAANFQTSDALSTICLARITGVTNLDFPKSNMQEDTTNDALKQMQTQLRNRLEAALAPNNALFVEEKQNLYIDDVQEARRWAGVLQQLTVSHTYQRYLLVWAIAGLEAFMIATQDREGGPLSWVSRSEVYTLAMRILIASGVCTSRCFEDSLAAERDSLVRTLQRFRSMAFGKTLHELWRREIDRILVDRTSSHD